MTKYENISDSMYQVMTNVVPHMSPQTKASCQCVCKGFKELIIFEKPKYVNIIIGMHKYVNNHKVKHGMYTTTSTTDASGWKMRVSFIDGGARIRMEFRQSDSHKWSYFGKFLPKNMKRIIYRAIRKDKQININGTSYLLEHVLINVATSFDTIKKTK